MSESTTASDTWSLHNPLKSWTLHGLALREAQILVSTMSSAEKQVCLVWTESWPAWRRLVSSEATVLTMFEAQTSSLKAPPLPKTTEPDEITQVQIPRTTKRQDNGRIFVRYEARIPVEVICAGQTFRTHTENLSEGGLKLCEPLPDWVAGYFTVILRREDRSLELTCMLIEDQGESKYRVAVVETADEESHLPLYKEWVGKLIRGAMS